MRNSKIKYLVNIRIHLLQGVFRRRRHSLLATSVCLSQYFKDNSYGDSDRGNNVRTVIESFSPECSYHYCIVSE